MHKLPILAILGVVVATVLGPRAACAQSADIPVFELVGYRESKFKKCLIKEGLSLGEFENIVPVMGGISYGSARSGFTPGQTNFEMTEYDKNGLKQLFGSVMVGELMKSKRFPVVGKPEKASLRLSVSLEGVLCHLPPPATRRQNPANDVLTAGFVAELRDFRTGAVVMRVTDKRRIRELNGVDERENVFELRNVKNQFKSWAERLRKDLESLAKK